MELTEDEIAEVIDQAENLAKWSKLVKDYALEQALNNGVKYPGFKVVEEEVTANMRRTTAKSPMY